MCRKVTVLSATLHNLFTWVLVCQWDTDSGGVQTELMELQEEGKWNTSSDFSNKVVDRIKRGGEFIRLAAEGML